MTSPTLKKASKTFYLIDGHAQLFRAYYAPFRPLTAPDGEPVKAVYIFAQLLLNVLTKIKPDYFAVTFDVATKDTFRADVFPEYKANRDAAPEDLMPQFMRVRELIELLGIPIFEIKGFEADDIIATIAKKLEVEDVELRIASKDKDLHQILSHKVALWDPSNNDLLDAEKLLADHGYTPEQALEMQVLTGDTIDNIPGAKGVGIKTAQRLITQYGTAENVLAHHDELTPKLKENILAHGPHLDLTRELVTLRQDVPVQLALEDCRLPKVNTEAVVPLFHELGFRTLIDQLPGGGREELEQIRMGRHQGEFIPVEYATITLDAFPTFLGKLGRRKSFSFDLETTGIPAVSAEIVGIAFSWNAGEGWYVPISGSEVDSAVGQMFFDHLKPILESRETLKVGQNLKYDIIVLEEAGVTLGGEIFDTMVAAHLLYPERRTYNLEDLSRDLLNTDTMPLFDLIGKGKTQISMFDVELDEVADYAAEDADMTWRLYEHLEAIMGRMDEQTRELYRTIEAPLVRVLAEMERTGISLDTAVLTQLQQELASDIQQLQLQIMEAAGKEFNPDSPKQLADVLFDDLGFRVVKRTKTSRSTNAEVLETLAAEVDHPLPDLILQYRERVKLLNTYVTPLPTFIQEKTGRLHASFHQTGTATGRLSSSDPNIQNIPVRSEMGRAIRAAFVAKPDFELVRADYSQVELRMLAHFSEDPELLDAFEQGRDIHSFVASQIFDESLSEVTRAQRDIAKTVNFGIIYGQTAFGLARTLKIPQADAQSFIDAYRKQYTGIQSFLESCVQEARDTGYVRTIMGRRRKIDEVRSRNYNMRMLGERLAINTVIQGSAADLIKIAMVNVVEQLRNDFYRSQLLIQVHDELVFEVPKEDVREVQNLVVETMESALTLRVPLLVETAHGRNWMSEEN